MKYCCDMMKSNLKGTCKVHGRTCADTIMKRLGGRICIPIHDGGSSGVVINYCPWCGTDIRKPEIEESAPALMIVRLWDMMDGWADISEPISKEEATRLWNEKTGGGKHNISYNDGDYYQIFPADTKMRVTPEFLRR